jgi:hypothetical protein
MSDRFLGQKDHTEIIRSPSVERNIVKETAGTAL